MKRPAAITLLALGAGAVTIYSFSSDDGATSVPDDGSVFTSKEQCVAAGTIAKEDCETGWTDALHDHEASAPHYASMAECEKVYGPGKCTAPTRTTAASYFIPAMAGYMIGRSWMSEGYRAAPLLRRPGDRVGQYGFTGGNYSGYVGGGSSSSRGSYGHSWSRTRSSVSSRPASVRGGFGSTGHGFSGHAGS